MLTSRAEWKANIRKKSVELGISKGYWEGRKERPAGIPSGEQSRGAGVREGGPLGFFLTKSPEQRRADMEQIDIPAEG